MKTVWKYTLAPGTVSLSMPFDAQPIDVQMQGSEAVMWAIVEDTHTRTIRHFTTIGTGHVTNAELDRSIYVGTLHGVDGWMVFHVFEVAV